MSTNARVNITSVRLAPGESLSVYMCDSARAKDAPTGDDWIVELHMRVDSHGTPRIVCSDLYMVKGEDDE